MLAIFHLKKEPPKKQILILLRGRCFLMGGSIGMNVGVFWETSGGFLKCVLLQIFPKYSQSYANLNVKSSQNSTALKK